MSNEPTAVQAPSSTGTPPLAERSIEDARQSDGARATLHRLASELVRTHNRKLLVEFLQLRRSLR